MKRLIFILSLLIAVNVNGQFHRHIPMGIVPVVSVTYATFNPSDKGPSIALSGGNLIATCTGSVSQLVKGTLGKTSGKWYFEVKTTNISTENPAIGIATSLASTTEYVGGSTISWGFAAASGLIYNNSSSSAYSSAITDSDWLGIAIDIGAGTITFYKNGVSLGTAFSGLGAATYLPAFGGYNTSNLIGQANFGQNAWAFAPPAGYTGWF